MKETPLLTFTKADDAGCGTREPGDLDFIIHGNDLTNWLSNGNVENAEDTAVRRLALAAELRKMADHLIAGDGPLEVTVEFARKRYAERAREATRRMNA
jgi:hypothetical protein